MPDDAKFEETSRDILVMLRGDMKHVREKVDHLVESDGKQWERLDTHSVKIEKHDSTMGFLLKGFWAGVTGIAGLALAWITGKNP